MTRAPAPRRSPNGCSAAMTKSPSPSGFTLPLTFTSGSQDSLLTSFRNARPTCMKQWTRGCEGDAPAPGGLVVGCGDGTLYVFYYRSPSSLAGAIESPPPELAQHSRVKSPIRHSRTSFHASRSASPSTSSHNAAPFLVSQRSRVVSGVNTEQVEAPKNYVDFDDEPDKLKEMLKGKNRHNRSSSDAGSDRTVPVKSPTPPSPSIVEPTPGKRKDLLKVLINSSLSQNTPRPFSAPTSPKDRASPDLDLSDNLNLQFHVIPYTTGSGNAVKSVSFLVDALICIVLQESGFLYLFSLTDGQCLASVQAKDGLSREQLVPKDRDVLYETYTWCNLQLTTSQQTTYIIASASNNGAVSSATPDAEDIPQERTLSVLYALVSGQETRPLQHTLDFLGAWDLNCAANSISMLTDSEGRDSIYSIDADGKLSSRNLKVLPDLPVQSSPDLEAHSTHINIPNPFKLKSRSSEHLPAHGTRINLKVLLDEPQELGQLSLGSAPYNFTLRRAENQLLGVVWTQLELIVVECTQLSCDTLHRCSVQDVGGVEWLDDCRYAVFYEDRVEIYLLQHTGAGSVGGDQAVDVHYCSKLEKSLSLNRWDTIVFPSSSELLIIASDSSSRQIRAYIWDEAGPAVVSRALFKSSALVSPGLTTTALLPLDVGLIIQGNSNGQLQLLSLDQMCHSNGAPPEPLKVSDRSLGGHITSLHFITNPRTKEKYIVGGADDASVAFWTINNLELCGRWTLFNTVLDKVVQFPEERGSPLYGCVLCVAEDGAIAVIAADGFQFLYLIPGACANLESVCLGGDNLLLIYADRRCRLWNVQTKEFWRSTGIDRAHEMLDQGGWTRIDLADSVLTPSTVWSVPAGLPKAPDAVSTLSLQAEQFITATTAIAKTISTSLDQTRAILQSLDRLRTVLSTLLTPGLSEEVDSTCKVKLGIGKSDIALGLAISDSVSIFNTKENKDVWCISGNVTATRLLGIVVVLKAVALFEEYAEAANSVIAFYTSSLSSCIGAGYMSPSLSFLANLWFHGSNELRQAIHITFDACISQMSDDEAISTMEHWQQYVPCLQLPSERESVTAALSLFICGYIAVEKCSFLPAPVLRDISKSISLYLLDEKSIYRVLAIDLCSRGFTVWQHYIDAMEILRSLFMLATTSRKADISLQNVGLQARSAVLHIASNNTPLFMSTLGLDILTPPSLEHRRSVLQIVAFLIRKRPSVLQPNLPKLMEAVVKSLDPNNTTNRDAVLDTATEIIGYVVKTFPSVDFHMSSQRLAVGTQEGAVIMYDLKTAIRLFVLEGHKKAITALSFSPDGRRLVTLSMEESVALVWKVGTSFVSFFTPGAPPRQGNSGGQPFRTFSFNIGSEGVMSVVEALTQVKFDWASDRSVKLKIRESTLTFST